MNLPALIKSFDDLPQIVKIILALPGIDVIWVIYRIIRSVNDQNIFGVILGVILLVGSFSILWIIDIFCIIMNDRVWWF